MSNDNFYSLIIIRFKESEKTLNDRQIALEEINEVFFKDLDQYLYSDYFFDKPLLTDMRQAHKNAIYQIWRIGAIIY